MYIFVSIVKDGENARPHRTVPTLDEFMWKTEPTHRRNRNSAQHLFPQKML